VAILTGVWRGLTGLVYPPACWMCDREVLPAGRFVPLCVDCESDLFVLPSARCPGCAKVILSLNPSRKFCRECRSGFRRFDRAHSVFVYGGTFRKIWHQVKFLRHPERIQALTDRAVEEMDPSDEFNPYLFDVYTWVPTSAGRLKERGFDPAEEIARHLAAKYVRPCENLLYRIRECRPQFELSRTERLKNVDGAFAANLPSGQRSRAVLLIDDILTTGATASACAAALKSRGFQKVVLFTLARSA